MLGEIQDVQNLYKRSFNRAQGTSSSIFMPVLGSARVRILAYVSPTGHKLPLL
jgi:hypothetical protein